MAPSIHVIDSPTQIAALRSPVRQEIVDALQALGEAPVAELATVLGRAADSLYYHLRELERVKLIRRTGARHNGTRSEALFALIAPRIRLRYEPGSRAQARSLKQMVGSMLRLGERSFAAALDEGEVVCDGPRRNLWAARVKCWLTRQEVEQVNHHLQQIVDICQQPRDRSRRRLHSLCFVLSPTPATGPGRGRKEDE